MNKEHQAETGKQIPARKNPDNTSAYNGEIPFESNYGSSNEHLSWETACYAVRDERDQYKAHAERLAEALRKIQNTHVADAQRIAREALAQWEAAQ